VSYCTYAVWLLLLAATHHRIVWSQRSAHQITYNNIISCDVPHFYRELLLCVVYSYNTLTTTSRSTHRLKFVRFFIELRVPHLISTNDGSHTTLILRWVPSYKFYVQYRSSMIGLLDQTGKRTDSHTHTHIAKSVIMDQRDKLITYILQYCFISSCCTLRSSILAHLNRDVKTRERVDFNVEDDYQATRSWVKKNYRPDTISFY